MFSRSWIVASLVALSVPVLPSASVNGVTYGDPVENPQIDFPEVVPVWVGGNSLCSGTLIEQQVVLTAAHCVYGQNGPFQISVGGSTLNNGRLIDVDATWYHPRYDAAFSQNDIALLHLKIPANVSRLGVLPKARMSSQGKKFLIVGWGRDQNGTITGKLHSLTLNDQTVASRKIFKNIYNRKTMIGAGKYFPDEILYGGGCTGDSGGPLYMGAKGATRTVIGLTSFGARGCTVYQPTVFTRVDFYVNEIGKGIQLLNSRSATTPIATGKATPQGIGPTTTTTTTTSTTTTTTTTTTIPRTTTTTSTTTTTRSIAKLEITYMSHRIGGSSTDVTIRSKTDAATIVNKVCISVTSNGVPFTDIIIYSGGGWNDAGGGCMTNARSQSWDNTYAASPGLRDPAGIQTWVVLATVFDTLGRSASQTYSFTS